jgi:putative toxin-antitoxin system antitoxin component (TIGR02293 family)
LFRLSALFQKALEVLGEPEEAKRWFTTPKKALGGKTPMEFSETDVGAREVEDLLGRIEYGVYA